MSISHERIALERFEQAARALGLEPERGQGVGNRIPLRKSGAGLYYQRGDLRVELPDATVIVEVESSGGVTNLAKYWECIEHNRLDKPIRLLHLFRQKSENDYASHFVVWDFLAEKMARDLGNRFTSRRMLYRDGDKAGLEEAVEEFRAMLRADAAIHPSPAFARLLAQALDMAASSTHPAAASFDVEHWLVNWLRVPQPALGGRRPEEMLDTPAGIDAVSRVMGAIHSGAFV